MRRMGKQYRIVIKPEEIDSLMDCIRDNPELRRLVRRLEGMQERIAFDEYLRSQHYRTKIAEDLQKHINGG